MNIKILKNKSRDMAAAAGNAGIGADMAVFPFPLPVVKPLRGILDLDNIEDGCVKKMLGNLNEVTSQIRNAWRLGADAVIKSPELVGNVEKMVIAGVGGSGIGARLVKKFGEYGGGVPVFTANGYRLPEYMDERTLAVLVSHSGETRETISCYDKAKASGAACVVVSSGGRLSQAAAANDDTLITIPGDLMPRESVAYLTVPVLLVAGNFGLWDLPSGRLLDILEAVNDVVFSCNEFVSEAENQAKQLAKKLYGKTPVILGVEGFMESAAYCWKTMFNENAKLPALANTIPEFCHNEIEAVNDDNYLVILRTMTEDTQLKRQIAALEQVAREKNIGVETVWLMGKSALAKSFGMMVFGDYVSLYLAQLLNKDCTCIPVVDSLKRLV